MCIDHIVDDWPNGPSCNKSIEFSSNWPDFVTTVISRDPNGPLLIDITMMFRK